VTIDVAAPTVESTRIEQVSAAVAVGLEAPGGFGKTRLARALVARWDLVAVVLDADDVPADRRGGVDAAAAMLVAGLRRAGLTEPADVVAGLDPASVAGLLPAALATSSRPVCLVLDEVQRLGVEAAAWLAEVAGAVSEEHRIVVAGRSVPAPLAALVDHRGLWLHAEQLRFDEGEIARLVADRRRLAIDDPSVAVQAAGILRSTDGWPVAVDVLVQHPRLMGGEGPVDAHDVVGALVRGLLGPLDEERREAAARLASVPLLSPSVAAVLGGDAALADAEAAGLPLVRRPDGWRTIPDPIRAAIDPPLLAIEEVRVVASEYARAGELAVAAQFLYHHDREGIPPVFGGLHWTVLESAGVSFCRVLASLTRESGGDPSVRAGLLLALARAVSHADPALRRELLDVADRVVGTDAIDRVAGAGAIDAVGAVEQLGREIAGELAVDAASCGDLDRVEREVARALAGERYEPAARARALYASGLAETIRANEVSSARAAEQFAEAAELAALVGEQRWQTESLLRLGYAVHFHAGDIDAAIAAIDRALALVPAASRTRAVMLTFAADVFDFAGRVADAEAVTAEALAIGARLRDDRISGLARWAAATIAAHQGDRDRCAAEFATAASGDGAWLASGSGAELHLSASDTLYSLGDEQFGNHYFELAKARVEQLGVADALVPLVARREAMFGDPVRAEELLAELDERPFAVARFRYVRALLRACAAHRRGDGAAADRYVAAATAAAASCGYPDVIIRHERFLVDLLERPAQHPVVPADAATRELRLLGGFSLRIAGVDATPPKGNPASLVKLLALRSTMTADEVIDALWPDADMTTGRSRLRNTLNRLRARSGDVVVRTVDGLALADDVAVDVESFETTTQQALSGDAAERVGLARRAASLYRGELLPGDRYEDWAAAARERLRRRYLALVDLLAADAEARGDVDEAVRQLEIAIGIEPLDDARSVRAARLLLAQGRRAGARELADRAAAAAAELGVAVSGDLRELLDELAPAS